MQHARITIKGDNLKYTTVLPLLAVADIIAYIDKYHRKNELKRIPYRHNAPDATEAPD